MKRVLKFCMLLFAVCLLVSYSNTAYAAKKYRIAFSNSYAGNTFRQQNIKSWEKVAKEAMDKGLIEEAPAFSASENTPAAQIADIQNLILQGYDAIIINAASSTALNGAIKDARESGIVVVSFDNPVDYEDSWKLIGDYNVMGYSEVEYLNKRFKGEPINVLEIRGIAGNAADAEIHGGIQKGFDKFTNIKKVGTVYGSWTQTIAQKEVAGILPSLPKIDAVVTQGGDGYGAVKAFEAAGRPVPVVIMGNRYDELEIWKKLHEKNEYTTMSIASNPASSQIAFWTALEVLNGNDVPKSMTLPYVLTVLQPQLDAQLATMTPGTVAMVDYPQKWVQDVITAYKAGKPLPANPTE